MPGPDEIQKIAGKLYDDCRGDARKLALYAAQYQSLALRGEGGTIMVLAGVTQEGRPFVQVNVGESRVMQSPERAREFAASVLDGAYGAEADAALFNLARDRFGCDDAQAMEIVQDLRAQQGEGEGNGAAPE